MKKLIFGLLLTLVGCGGGSDDCVARVLFTGPYGVLDYKYVPGQYHPCDGGFQCCVPLVQ